MNYTITVQENAETGELFIEFPEDMLATLGWKEGDDLIWEGNNKTYYVRKKDASTLG